MADPWNHPGGNFFLPRRYAPPRAPDLPMRPPAQAGPAPPTQNYYVDRVERVPGGSIAVLSDEHGNMHDAPAEKGWREGLMTDGSVSPSEAEGAALRARLGADDGRNFSLEDLGASLPKVPLAPGSPGPALPPPADSFIGQKKGQGRQGKRRVTP